MAESCWNLLLRILRDGLIFVKHVGISIVPAPCMLRECTLDKNANIFLDDNVTRCANGKDSGANLKSFASV